jgi:hypothetical protein
MRITKLLLICMCCIMVVPSVWGQAPNGQAKSGILGYLDPHTGAFRPVAAAAEEGRDPVTLTTFTGTITVTLTITVKSTALNSFSCSAAVSVLDDITGSARGYDESATASATGTGTTRTCKLTIPYAWALATQSSDSMTITYGAFGTVTGTTTVRTSGLSPLDTLKVPANGATTDITAAVTL